MDDPADGLPADAIQLKLVLPGDSMPADGLEHGTAELTLKGSDVYWRTVALTASSSEVALAALRGDFKNTGVPLTLNGTQTSFWLKAPRTLPMAESVYVNVVAGTGGASASAAARVVGVYPTVIDLTFGAATGAVGATVPFTALLRRTDGRPVSGGLTVSLYDAAGDTYATSVLSIAENAAGADPTLATATGTVRVPREGPLQFYALITPRRGSGRAIRSASATLTGE